MSVYEVSLIWCSIAVSLIVGEWRQRFDSNNMDTYDIQMRNVWQFLSYVNAYNKRESFFRLLVKTFGVICKETKRILENTRKKFRLKVSADSSWIVAHSMGDGISFSYVPTASLKVLAIEIEQNKIECS